MALAHVIENKVEAAYRRGDLFAKRRKMMQEWANYLDKLKAGGGDHADQSKHLSGTKTIVGRTCFVVH